MAFQRFLPKTLALTSSSFVSRSFFTSVRIFVPPYVDRSILCRISRIRPLMVVADFRRVLASPAVRSLATRATSSSLNDPNPNWSNRPPKETILLDGCDFEHWLIVMEKPEGEPTRDEIIDSYIKTLAMVVGSEEEARMKIYSVSTRCYFAFGALVSEELSYKIKELPKVRWVLPDSYLDVKNKNYGGEPFIDGQAVPYDPIYHEEWIRNNARANERNRRNDRPRNFDRSRNFERRRDNMQNRDFQNPSPPMQNMSGAPSPSNMSGGPPPSNMSGASPPNMSGATPPNMAGMSPNMGGIPPNDMGGAPSGNYGRMPPNNMGGVPPSNMGGGRPPYNTGGGGPPYNSGSGGPPYNMGGGGPPSNMGGGGPPYNSGGGGPPYNTGGGPPNNMGGGGPPYNTGGGGGGGGPPYNTGGGGPQYNMGGGGPPYNTGGGGPPNNMGGMPPYNYGGNRVNMPPPPPSNFGEIPNNNMGRMPEREEQNGLSRGNFPGGNPYST